MYYGQVGWCGSPSPEIKKLWKDISHNFKEFRERLPCNTTHPLNEMDILLAHWVICTMSWGHEMCQLLNSFKLMGTDEHMGGQRGRPTNSELWKRECQLTLRLRSINILLRLKPALYGYKLESLDFQWERSLHYPLTAFAPIQSTYHLLSAKRIWCFELHLSSRNIANTIYLHYLQ